MYYVGIDIAKRSHQAAIIDESGHSVCQSFSFSNTQEGCESVLAALERHDISKEDVMLGMESTGHYWLSVYCFFMERGFTPYAFNPIQSDSFRNMFIRQTKTDKVDAFIIAQIMRFGQFSATSLSDEKTMSIRQLSRYRFSLVDNCSDIKRKVIALLDQVFPEYADLFSDIFGVTSREILLNYQSPEDMLSVNPKNLAAVLKKASRGHFGSPKVEQLQKAARNSFGITFAKDAFCLQIKQLIEQLNMMEKQLKEIEKELKRLLKDLAYVITSITGIGDVLGSAIIGEIGDIKRFSSPSKLVAYAGLDSSVKQSGQFVGTQTRISKRGSPYLRRAIWLAATVAAFSDPALSKYYQSLRDRGKHHLTAIGAVARKMCNIIYAVLLSGTPYTPAI